MADIDRLIGFMAIMQAPFMNDPDALAYIEEVKTVLKQAKAQQPRVLNLNEIHRGMAVWLEELDKLDVVLAIGGSSAGGVKCFITEDDRSIAPLDADYGKRWRAWTREPTEVQREATPWKS